MSDLVAAIKEAQEVLDEAKAQNAEALSAHEQVVRAYHETRQAWQQSMRNVSHARAALTRLTNERHAELFDAKLKEVSET